MAAQMVAWRRLDFDEGLESLRLEHSDDGVLAHGRTVARNEHGPWWFGYSVAADRRWRTTEVTVESASTAARRAAVLECNNGTWTQPIWNDGAGRTERKVQPEFEGCVDVDLFGSLFTNTLAIRRLDLRVGDAADVDVVWIDVPSLEMHRSPQRYTRVEDLRYEFASLDSDFRAEVTVDSRGLVVSYEGLAERLGDDA